MNGNPAEAATTRPRRVDHLPRVNHERAAGGRKCHLGDQPPLGPRADDSRMQEKLHPRGDDHLLEEIRAPFQVVGTTVVVRTIGFDEPVFFQTTDQFGKGSVDPCRIPAEPSHSTRGALPAKDVGTFDQQDVIAGCLGREGRHHPGHATAHHQDIGSRKRVGGRDR